MKLLLLVKIIRVKTIKILKNPQTADLMVHNIKHDYDQQEDQMAAIIRGHMYPTRKTLRRRELTVFQFFLNTNFKIFFLNFVKSKK